MESGTVMNDQASANPAPLRYYSWRQILLGTFLGSTICGAYLVAQNFKTLGRPKQVKGAYILGVGLVAAAVGIDPLLPPHASNTGIAFICAAVFAQYARQAQGKAIADRLAAGDALRSWWTVAGIGLLFMVAVLAVVVAVMFGYQLVSK
jgi:hypothetical protein